MPVLTEQDHAFFDKNGYVVIHNAVPQENLDNLVNKIWEFLEMDRNNPDDWYRPPHVKSGNVEMYQNQTLWDNRQYPRLYEAFSEILGTSKLWVSFDRCGMKPPYNPKFPDWDNKGFTHWDLDLANIPAALRVQGVLCLTDTSEEMGGFRCVPGHHKQLDEYIKTQADLKRPDVSGLNAVPIPAKAGDLIIWTNLLAHGNGRNVSDRPRLAQYLSMFPAREDNEQERQSRIDQWQNRRAPQGAWVQGDPRNWEETREKTAELTPLGRKLCGVDKWED